MVEWVGLVAVAGMVFCYAAEPRGVGWVFGFAGFCGLAAGYAFAIGSWPFVAAEGLWAALALNRALQRLRRSRGAG